MLNNHKFDILKRRDIAELEACVAQIYQLIAQTGERHQDGDYIGATVEALDYLSDLIKENRTAISGE